MSGGTLLAGKIIGVLIGQLEPYRKKRQGCCQAHEKSLVTAGREAPECSRGGTNAIAKIRSAAVFFVGGKLVADKQSDAKSPK